MTKSPVILLTCLTRFILELQRSDFLDEKTLNFFCSKVDGVKNSWCLENSSSIRFLKLYKWHFDENTFPFYHSYFLTLSSISPTNNARSSRWENAGKWHQENLIFTLEKFFHIFLVRRISSLVYRSRGGERR